MRSRIDGSDIRNNDGLPTTLSNDFHLADLMTVDQAVERFPIFTRLELLAAMRAGDLRHRRRGKIRLVTEQWLKDYVRPQIQGGRGDVGRTGVTSDTSDPRLRDGPPPRRMTPEEEATMARLLREKILRKPRKTSPRSR